jgi:uncharacterized protein YdhG (YjbR/CyaY superfamily)
MTRRVPRTIAEYIRSAPPAGRPHLRRLHAILGSVAPKAEQTIKWGVPFFVEPRFLFSFAAFRAHCVFAPAQGTLAAFREELKGHTTTKNYLKIPYDEPVPEALVRKLARHSIRNLGDRESFW